MLATDRAEFNDHLGTLCAGFNVPITDLRAEAYWRGLAQMHLGQFARVVEFALGPDGPERIPTAPACWAIWRNLRNRRTSQPRQQASDPPFDTFGAFGNRCLMRFLTATGAASDEDLPRLLEEKNRLADNFRMVAAEFDVPAEEVRRAMIGSFSRLTGRRFDAG